jgi:hypothetical protein
MYGLRGRGVRAATREWRGSGYSFTPPAVRPDCQKRCRKMKAAMSGMTDKIPLQALGRVRVGSNEPALRATHTVLAEGVVVEHLHVIGRGGVPDRGNLRRVEPGGELDPGPDPASVTHPGVDRASGELVVCGPSGTGKTFLLEALGSKPG